MGKLKGGGDPQINKPQRRLLIDFFSTNLLAMPQWRRFCYLSFLTLMISMIIMGYSNIVSATDNGAILELDDHNESYQLGKYFEILEDKEKKFTIEDVSSPQFNSQFISNQKTVPIFGYSTSAFWVKFKLHNSLLVPHEWLLEINFPRMNHVDLYWANDKGTRVLGEPIQFIKKSSGTYVPYSQREINAHNIVFSVPMAAQEERICYLRLESLSVMGLPANIWDSKAYYKMTQLNLLMLGIYFGILIALMTYNSFLFVAVRDRIYLLYVLSSLAITLLQTLTDGLATQYFWPEHPAWTNNLIQLFTIQVCMWTVILGREYLCLKKNAPKMDLTAQIVIVWCALLSLVTLFFYYTAVPKVVSATALLVVILMMSSAIVCLRNNFLPARYYFISLFTAFLGGSAILLRNLDLLPSTFWVHYSFHFGTALEVILLSLGLADRLRILQKEKRDVEIEVAVKDKDSEIFRLRNVELTEANLKMKELDQVKSNFAAMLVHDLKSPLAVVRTALELIQEDRNIQKENRDLLATCERGIERILTLVNEVLELYRSESQDMKLDLRSIDAVSLINDCAEAAQLTALQNKITIIVNIKDRLPSIMGDTNKLERAFSNLLSNAIKFTPAGGKITVDAWIAQGQGVEVGLSFLMIEITDTGEGVSPEAIPYLFEPYRQGETKKRYAGVGLGLAIVKRVIAAHGGNISVRSQVGVGSSFTIALPTTLVKANLPALPEVQPLSYQKNDRPRIKEEQAGAILVVDDDMVSQMLMKAQLQRMGYEIQSVANGHEALNALQQREFDLILMDCNMPGINGYDTTKEIRRIEIQYNQNASMPKHIPIVAFTIITSDVKERCYKVGMDDILEKPFQVNQLQNIIRKWIPAKQARFVDR